MFHHTLFLCHFHGILHLFHFFFLITAKVENLFCYFWQNFFTLHSTNVKLPLHQPAGSPLFLLQKPIEAEYLLRCHCSRSDPSFRLTVCYSQLLCCSLSTWASAAGTVSAVLIIRPPTKTAVMFFNHQQNYLFMLGRSVHLPLSVCLVVSLIALNVFCIMFWQDAPVDFAASRCLSWVVMFCVYFIYLKAYVASGI